MPTEEMVPKLRFKKGDGELFDVWVKAELNQVFDKVKLKNKFNESLPVLTNSAKNGIVIQEDFFERDIANKNNLEGYYIVEIGDFVYNPRISKYAPVGPINWNKLKKGLVSPLYTVFRLASSEIENNFLSYLFDSSCWHKYLKSIANYGARYDRMNLTNEGFFGMPLNIPTLQEQQKIASFLSSVDDKISLLEKKKTLLETYKRGIMQKIFSQELRFKDENGQEFPEWKEDVLGNIFDHKKGTGLSGKELDKDGEFPCILYGALYTKYDEVIKNVIEFSNIPGKVKSISGDLLVPASTTTSGIDLANFTALNQDGVSLGGDITIMRNKDKGDNSFWAYYLTHFHKKGIAKYAQGTTIVHLYFSHFKHLVVKYPSFKEQQKIASFLSSIDKKIEITSTQLEKTREFKKGLLQQMFV